MHPYDWRFFMNEHDYERMLNIRTNDMNNGVFQSTHYNRYEPTPYFALEELLTQYEITTQDHVVDFGCGMGRLNFFLHHKTRASVVGIEMNDQFIREALKNEKSYRKKFKTYEQNIQFHCCFAEKYKIQPKENKFYFFNPFSIPIFIKVLNNILLSVEESKRSVDVILYYPSDDYIFYLDHHTPFERIKEVTLPKLYDKNPQERFLIYRYV